MVRKPAVAGQFYPSDPEELKKLIASFGIKKAATREKAIACMLPHAGYVYSGKIAAEVLSKINIGETCILLGPNHTGYGTPASIMTDGEWETPIGVLNIDTQTAKNLLKNSTSLQEDHLAHVYEHSIEVELPLIQELCRNDFSIVPIILATNEYLMYKDIAGAIAKTIKDSKKDITIIASSDMTHYELQPNANKKDGEAIKSILKLDAKELLEKIERYNISMCGYGPAVVALLAAKELGAESARLVAYQTSGDVLGDYSSVVGYAGIIIQ